ncbi:hypothetical protein F5Y14DRAFT_207213 [Nemania sp. NC0429]|nr:hypothetical protein F5Y14DRAFT_207213 [Nemania sp. NC0429]
MATSPKHSPPPERIAAEDPDTAAARKELRQTAISEKPDSFAMATKNGDKVADDAESAGTPPTTAPSAAAPGKATTPELAAPDDTAKEQISSPKKKRARDEVDEPKDATAGADADGDVSPIGAHGGAALNRTDRSEPEKKRPRDISSESKPDLAITGTSLESGNATKSSTEKRKSEEPTSDKPVDTQDKVPAKNSKTTTASAFKSSGMSNFATQSSPFLQAGTGKTLSSFASASSSTPSPFGFSVAATKSVFGGGGGAASPFGQITGTSTSFGTSAFGGFGSTLGGSRLPGFGKPGESLKSTKPARPFGAPASDDEGGGEGDEEEDGNASENDKEKDKDETKNQDAEEDKATETEDKKKPKLQRVAVDDGEAGEATLLQVRGKLYNLDKTSNSWKERGAGNLKINVPMACVRNDDPSLPLSGTFDASALKNAESKVVRLVMRQDSTHRVILNTALIPTMKFQEKSSLKATYILFTAIEDGGAVSVQIKMNAANAKSFLNEVESLQLQLQSV